MTDAFEFLGEMVPFLAVLAVVSLLLMAGYWGLLGRRQELGAESRLPRQLMMGLLGVIGILIVLLSLPIGDTTRGQILSFLGAVLTAVIGLSATTFISNAMAGVLLRMVNTFRPGDFIRVSDQWGRVSERGLFHTEIQTEDRDLTSFPNLYLITNPVSVVHRTGTMISATVSLGYELPRDQIEEALKQAATNAELEEPFVQVTELGDYSVHYRVVGFLAEVKQLLTVRSNLRKCMLDALHAAGIEIVSPSFMNQRPLAPEQRFIPARKVVTPPSADTEAPEAKIFEDADKAEELHKLKRRHAKLVEECVAATKAGDGDPEALKQLEQERDQLKEQLDELSAEHKQRRNSDDENEATEA